MKRKIFTVRNIFNVTNLIDVLGLSNDAEQADVKRAFLQLAKKYHPDVNKTKDAKTRFSEINEAYETLNDESRRQKYDTYGWSANEQKNQEEAGMDGGFDWAHFGFAFGNKTRK
jgi:DnaJ-class molecular chaperone